MRNKKGFTLVELVIVIAVIAILAGVMIGTFASVVKKAKKSAEQQEMAAAKQEQVANDVIEKLNNGSWLGWTDFEEKLAKALADVNPNTPALTEASVKAAVAAALNEYAAAHPNTDKPNTGLTEQQVKYIIENALSGQLTAEQVKAIVNSAVSSTSTLTKSQVQAIVDAAQAKNLTLAQVTAAIANAVKDINEKAITAEDIDAKFAEVEKNLTASIKDLKDATLKESDIEALLAKYITNGEAKGDYTWYNANATTMAIANADQVVALSTMAKGGTSFAGKTIELPAEVDLTKTDFQPIMDFDGTLKGATKTENNKTVPATTVHVNVTPVWNTLDGRNGKTMMNFLRVKDNVRKDAVGYGFVASLLDGGVIENIVVDLEVKAKDPGNKYTYFGGIVGFLDGGIIKNCKVTGKIDAYGRIGGVVGYAKSGTISGVDVSELEIISNLTTGVDKQTYANIGGIAGYVSAGKLEVTGCKLGELDKYKVESRTTDNDQGAAPGLLFGVIDKWKKEAADGGEWGNGAGEETVISITDCGIADDVDMNTLKTLYGWHGENITFNLNGQKVTLPANNNV